MRPALRKLILDLFEIGALKFGAFTLKSGAQSPFYVDLRASVSYPSLLRDIEEAIWQKAQELSFDLVCGVPYTALPFATAFSLKRDIPMILKRKEKKNYGTGRMIEGSFAAGQTCLILEDVVTTGSSVLDTAKSLREEGLAAEEAIVLVDREQGGRENLQANGVFLHSVLTLAEIVDALMKEKRIDDHAARSVREFLSQKV